MKVRENNFGSSQRLQRLLAAQTKSLGGFEVGGLTGTSTSRSDRSARNKKQNIFTYLFGNNEK